MLKKELLKFIRLDPNLSYNIDVAKGLNLLTRLLLGRSRLGDQKFRILKQQPSSSFTAPIIIVQGSPLSQDKSSKWKLLKTG